MRSPQFNGETPPRIATPHFHSTLSVQKLRRFNTLILVFRLVAFCFSLSSVVFMLTNIHSDSANWAHFDAFRFVLAANGIVAVYSFVEMGVSVWEILKGNTLLPEAVQLWFDFGHDQGFAYLLLSANAAGTAVARTLREGDTCTVENAFCVQSYISIALGFGGFLFLGISSLISGFRVACYIITGSRSHLY
ncbi:CASP-like protein 4C1 [Tasmannia lanceolata]|uniref:CASP-like protein 4C1 n=1 Tax=Tasmannia lanceolata TaxID=3420 RepID=UPI004063240A